jgi:hypothetical protein
MPKKSRRSKTKKRAKLARIARERNSQQAAPAVVAPAVSDVPPKKKISEAQGSAIRYQYVMPELRRIGILTGVMLLILLVLSFIVG